MRSTTTGAMARGVLLMAVCGAALVSAQPPNVIFDQFDRRFAGVNDPRHDEVGLGPHARGEQPADGGRVVGDEHADGHRLTRPARCA